jgi:hypothetical protein
MSTGRQRTRLIPSNPRGSTRRPLGEVAGRAIGTTTGAPARTVRVRGPSIVASRKCLFRRAFDRPPTSPNIPGRRTPMYGWKTSSSLVGPEELTMIFFHHPVSSHLCRGVHSSVARIPAAQQHPQLGRAHAGLHRELSGDVRGPRNSCDLKSCKQEPGESLRDYIRRFSKQNNSLPDIIDVDVVSAFLSGITCKSLVHKLNY